MAPHGFTCHIVRSGVFFNWELSTGEIIQGGWLVCLLVGWLVLGVGREKTGASMVAAVLGQLLRACPMMALMSLDSRMECQRLSPSQGRALFHGSVRLVTDSGKIQTARMI